MLHIYEIKLNYISPNFFPQLQKPPAEIPTRRPAGQWEHGIFDDDDFINDRRRPFLK